MGSLSGVIGYALVVTGVCAWIMSSAMLFIVPLHTLPYLAFWILGSFDFVIMIATFWFVDKCRFLATLCISMLYLLRTIYLAMGFFPKINIQSVPVHHGQSASVVTYFVSSSFFAFLMLTILWLKECRDQVRDYKVRHQTLFINGKAIEMEKNQLQFGRLDANRGPNIIR